MLNMVNMVPKILNVVPKIPKVFNVATNVVLKIVQQGQHDSRCGQHGAQRGHCGFQHVLLPL